jgi:hypothetical protein
MAKPDYIQSFHKRVLDIWSLWCLPAYRNAIQGKSELRAPVSRLIHAVDEVLREMDKINRRQKQTDPTNAKNDRNGSNTQDITP